MLKNFLKILGFSLFFIFLLTKTVIAKSYCSQNYVLARENNALGIGGVNEPIYIGFSAVIDYSDQVLSHFIYDGYQWENAPFIDVFYDIEHIYKIRSYSEDRDFIVAGAWILLGPNGKTKKLICQDYLRIYKKEVLSLGSKTVVYSENNQENVEINLPSKYIGAIYRNGKDVNPHWYGDNRGYFPLAPTDWTLEVYTDNNLYKTYYAGTVAAEENGKWSRWNHQLVNIPYKDKLSQKITFTLKTPVFNISSSLSNKPYATYSFDNLIIYFRNNPYSTSLSLPPLLSPLILNKKIIKPTPTLTPPKKGYFSPYQKK